MKFIQIAILITLLSTGVSAQLDSSIFEGMPTTYFDGVMSSEDKTLEK